MKSEESIHDYALWLKQDQELDWNQQLDEGLAFLLEQDQELDWNQQLDISLAFWLEQAQELEPTESVTQGAWIRFGAGTSPDVAFWSLIGTWSGTCNNQELSVHCLNVEHCLLL